MRTSWMIAVWAAGVLGGCGGCGQSEDEKHPALDESKMVGAAELRALAKAQGVEPAELRCGAVGDSQAFTCLFELDEARANKLVTGWGLSADDPADPSIMRGKKYGCERFVDFSGDASAPYASWGSKENPAALAAMRYARVYLRRDLGRACVEMEHKAP